MHDRDAGMPQVGPSIELIYNRWGQVAIETGPVENEFVESYIDGKITAVEYLELCARQTEANEALREAAHNSQSSVMRAAQHASMWLGRLRQIF